MLKVERVSPNRLDIELGGKMDSEAMRVALDALVDKSAGIQNGRMLFDVASYALPTFGALRVEFSQMPRMFRFIRQFRRAAVLADAGWLKAASEIEGLLIPGLEIKAFSREQRTEAEQWLDSPIG
ncbi:STAS/SEC14 domain-containing protein [Marinihelvus fidelis]|uniref:STAS/SEC14 domain-containing protein n=1 Tax=Marinihelvus fidelis TaxID=2613842 RepID=A0A5N0TCM8_9GAMM|nr:STAS/SEC14 domain-containing protein [Marinihelvus fidelis]KAA9131827.1 STAS/SEC14 domain-containing protein [Marinihelvus fidelis]